MNSQDFITVHTDGGSRGNPGPAASAFIVEKGDKVLYKGRKYLGNATNNFAEYTAVILALNWLLEKSGVNFSEEKLVSFILDSELVVKQLNGVYKVKDENIKKLFMEVISKIKEIPTSVKFTHVRREQNKIADQLVNEELDLNT